MKECVICGNKVVARNWCTKHYLRWRRHGDPLHKPDHSQPKGKDSPNYKHGHWGHPLYNIWKNMLSRCYNKNDDRYYRYGARGISVCDRWRDIAAFIEDMGDRPIGRSIDRINNDGNYEPENCRWADATTQNRNKSFCKLTKEKADEIRSLTNSGMTRKQIAEQYGVSVATIKKIRSGEYWK